MRVVVGQGSLEACAGRPRLTWEFYEPLVEGAIYEVTGGVLYTTKRPALVVATPVVDPRKVRRAMRATSGYAGNYLDDADGWWGQHYPRRDTTRTYTWDHRTHAMVPVSDKPAGSNLTPSPSRGDLSLVGAGMLTEQGDRKSVV